MVGSYPSLVGSTTLVVALESLSVSVYASVAAAIQDETGLFLILSLFFIVGFGAIYAGFGRYRTGQIIKNTPTEKVRSMAVGRTELQGTARDAGLLFDQPFSSGKCLYYKYKVEELRKKKKKDEDGNTKTEKKWKTVSSGSMAAPFYLEDDTGQVLVVANEGANFTLSRDKKSKQTFSKGRSVPSSYKQFDTTVEVPEQLHDNVDTSSSGVIAWIRSRLGRGDDTEAEDETQTLSLSKPNLGSSGRKRRFTQEVLPPDTDVYVFGSAEIREDTMGSNEDRLTMQKDEGTGRFIVSDKDESRLSRKFRLWGGVFTVLGLGISTLCLYFLLSNFVFA